MTGRGGEGEEKGVTGKEGVREERVKKREANVGRRERREKRKGGRETRVKWKEAMGESKSA